MYLTPDALHRILSVPVVDTMAVVSYQLQDLWISPVAATTATLSTLQVSQLMTDGVFWRLEPMLFCDQPTFDAGEAVALPDELGWNSVISQNGSQYEMTCRSGLVDTIGGAFYGSLLLQKFNATPYFNPQGPTALGFTVGAKNGSLPYVYKPVSVSRVAFSKLTEWPHGFGIKREIVYANEQDRHILDFSNPALDTAPVTTTGIDTLALFNALAIAPVGLDEGDGTIDEKFFTFAPKFEASALNSSILQTLEDPQALGWQYIPIESKTTSQPFPTSTDQQSAYITAEVAKLFPLSTNPITPLDSSEAAALQTLAIRNLESASVQYLRDTASNYCSQFEWAHQARDFDAVALRQQRLLDFNAIPIAPLEMSKDYATLTTAPDAGLSCYGDLPAIAWAPDPTDDSKVFALCRYRPPMRVPMPAWDWHNIGLPDYLKQCFYITEVLHPDPSNPLFEIFKLAIFSTDTKKPFSTNKAWKIGASVVLQVNLASISFYDPLAENEFVTLDEGFRANSGGILGVLPLKAARYTNPLKYVTVNEYVGIDNPPEDLRYQFYPALSPAQCVFLAPRVLSLNFSFADSITPGEPPSEDFPYGTSDTANVGSGSITLYKQKGVDGSPDEYAQDIFFQGLDDNPSRRAQILDDLDGFRLWANTFFLDESSYSEIGRYRWIDENGTAMVDLPFYGHAAIFNSFNIDISLRSAPQG